MNVNALLQIIYRYEIPTDLEILFLNSLLTKGIQSRLNYF